MKKLVRRSLAVLLFLCVLPGWVNAEDFLIPSGQVIGLQLENQTLTVAAFDENLGSTAKKAGLKIGDQLLSVDGRRVQTTQEVIEALNQSKGMVELTVLRSGKEVTLRFSPAITENGPKLGVYLRQGITGVGTVTFYDPDTGRFGALGHSVNTPDGKPVEMLAGSAYDARILAVKKGRSGAPGQLLGASDAALPVGTLYKNTPQGVFGTSRRGFAGTPLPVGEKEDIHTGSATIVSTIEGETPREYSVEILKIYAHSGDDGRNMLLRVTDQSLLDATGGIVQGMSGSPIIQDGKLVGAVTHVLVNDPTTGYGIFIENMLDAAA